MKDECKEADEYVRDHLLIQWAYAHPYWFDHGSTIEDIYDHWMEWLKEMEDKNAKRS